MIPKSSLGAASIAILAMCSTAFAQSSANTNPAPENSAATPAAPNSGAAPAIDTKITSGASDQQKSSQMLATDIIGMSVKNGNGSKAQDIGKITNLVLDKNKKTVSVLVGVGGLLGIGAKDVGVPLNDIQFNPGSDVAVLHMTKDQLEKAPAYQTLADKKAKEQQHQPHGAGPASPLAPPPPPGGTGATQ